MRLTVQKPTWVSLNYMAGGSFQRATAICTATATVHLRTATRLHVAREFIQSRTWCQAKASFASAHLQSRTLILWLLPLEQAKAGTASALRGRTLTNLQFHKDTQCNFYVLFFLIFMSILYINEHYCVCVCYTVYTDNQIF